MRRLKRPLTFLFAPGHDGGGLPRRVLRGAELRSLPVLRGRELHRRPARGDEADLLVLYYFKQHS